MATDAAITLATLLAVTCASYGALRVLCSPLLARSLWASLCLTLLAGGICFEIHGQHHWRDIARDIEALKLAVIFLLLGSNLLSTPLLYGLDKWLAKRQWQRIPEAALHIPAFLGAAPGAAIAQRLFRHKTRKPAFRRVFFLSAASSALLYYLLLRLFWL